MPAPTRVQIIAHRGASRDRLENTMASFAEALRQGADGLELDVHATRDGVVVVHHDPDTRLTNRNGIAPNGERLTISTADYTTVAAVRLGNGESIPTLDDVLKLAAGKATVYVEIKGLGIESHVIDCLSRHPATDTAVHAFDHRIAQRIRIGKPGTPVGLLSASYLLDFEQPLRSAGARDLWQHTALIDQALVDTVHNAGARVVAWTENDLHHATELVGMGVDALCTDTPGEMRDGLVARGLL